MEEDRAYNNLKKQEPLLIPKKEENEPSNSWLCSCCTRTKEPDGKKSHKNEGLIEPETLDLFPVCHESLSITLNIDPVSTLSPSFLRSDLNSSIFAPPIQVMKEAEGDNPVHPVGQTDTEEDQSISLINFDKLFKEELKEIKVMPLRNNPHNNTKVVKKGYKFSKAEDELLRELVKRFGEGNWTQIADNMPGRNRKQLRERYVNYLKKNISEAEYTVDEDNLILSLVEKYGRKWSLISSSLPGRSPLMVKNRYYTRLRFPEKVFSDRSPSFKKTFPETGSSNYIPSPSHQSVFESSEPSTLKKGDLREVGLEYQRDQLCKALQKIEERLQKLKSTFH